MSKNEVLGYVIYEGPSEIDGAPIVVVVNKLSADSANEKTGGLVQTFIIRSDVPPTDALKSGEDASVCGDCKHRPILAEQSGEPPCYVNVGRSVLSVYGAYKRGRYTKVTPAQAGRLLKGKRIRLGTYGDPGAAPLKTWRDLIAFADGHTGYSHLWQRWTHHATRKAWQRLVMASVDNEAEYIKANVQGWRTFRVATAWDKFLSEVRCPASKEAGNKTTCEECLLCGGTTTQTHKNVVIIDHARGHKQRVIPLLPVAA
jgi:hypothetical protein